MPALHKPTYSLRPTCVILIANVLAEALEAARLHLAGIFFSPAHLINLHKPSLVHERHVIAEERALEMPVRSRHRVVCPDYGLLPRRAHCCALVSWAQVRALSALDGTIFQGRLLHIMSSRPPPRSARDDETDIHSKSYKKKKEMEQKAQSSSAAKFPLSCALWKVELRLSVDFCTFAARRFESTILASEIHSVRLFGAICSGGQLAQLERALHASGGGW
eukprot:6192987-Pleurochrysis_carterae.AAC.2